MKSVEIYVKGYCPYCRRAKELLDIKGAAYVEFEVTADALLHNEMVQRSGRNTVPQVFIDNQHVGGCEELFELDENGRLDPLLGPRFSGDD